MNGRGFTLIEVLVALAIVAIGMAALLGSLTSAADAVSYMRDRTFAEWVALNQVAQVRLLGQVPTTGDTSGEITFADRTWKWTQDVEPMLVPGMVRIDVSVKPSDVATADDKSWFATVSGVMGDAVALPNGALPVWNQTLQPGSTPNPPCPPTTPNCQPTVPNQATGTTQITPPTQTPLPLPSPGNL